MRRRAVMPNYSMQEPGYWEPPEDLRPLADRTESRRATLFRMGPRDDGTPVAMVLQMPPDYVIVRHAHACHRLEVITQGSLFADGRVLHPGDVMTAGPGEMYGPKVAGPDGCTTMEFFSEQRGIAGPITYELSDGSAREVNYLVGDERPEDEAAIAEVRRRAAEAFAAQ
jgi:hypothetical protein